MLVIGLVEEDVLAVDAVRGEVLQHALRADAVLGAQLLPELEANCNGSYFNGLQRIETTKECISLDSTLLYDF